MRFTINLSTRTYLDQKLVKRVGALILTLLIVMLLWNFYRTAWSFGELRRLRTDISSYENKLNSRPSGVSEKDYTRLLSRIGFYNEVIGRKSFSWMGLLDQVESATTDGIAFSALAPDKKTGILKIDGRARSFAHLRTFLDKLEDSKALTSVMLLTHSEIAAGEKTKGIQFSIACKAALK